MREKKRSLSVDATTSDDLQGGIGHFVRQNKAEVITGVVVAMLVIVAAASYFIFNAMSAAQQKADFEAYRESHSFQYQMGDVISLNSSEDEEGREHGLHANFGWKGTMELSLIDVSLYKNPADAGMGAEDALSESGDAALEYAKFAVCTLKLKNIDAIAPVNIPELGSQADHCFNCSVFVLEPKDKSDPIGGVLPAYFDGILPDAPRNWRYSFALSPGEEKTFKLGYFMSPKAVQSGLVFRIGVSGNDKYTVAVDLNQ